MADSKSGKSKRKTTDSKKSDGSAEIKRAEKRLVKALADVDEARETLQRRERDLAKLMERHGRIAPVRAVSSDAIPDVIPLEAPSQNASSNGTPSDGEDGADAELVEQAASTDGNQHPK